MERVTALGIAAFVASASAACGGKSEDRVGTITQRHDAGGASTAIDTEDDGQSDDATSAHGSREAGSGSDQPDADVSNGSVSDGSAHPDDDAEQADDFELTEDDPAAPDDAVDEGSPTQPLEAGTPSTPAPASCSATGSLNATDEQLAVTLSRALFGTLEPNARLNEAAEAGRLSDPAQLEIVVRELLDDPNVRQRLAEFAPWWLSSRAGQMPNVSKDPERYPAFDGSDAQAALLEAMLREGELFMSSQLDEPSSTFGSVLNDPYTYVNELTAELYGLDVSGDTFQRVSLPAEERFGLLSQTYFLTTRATNDSDPISRGSFVRERVLCQEIPEVPPVIDVVGPTIDDTTTTREFYEAWLADPTCWTCHRYFTQLGFGFENYDAVGRYRTQENGFPIDSSTTLVPFDGEPSVDFDGAATLFEYLSRDETAQRCFTRHWGLFMLGRYPEHASNGAEQSALQSLDFDGLWQTVSECAVSGGELNLHELLVAVASSPFVLEGSFGCGSTSCVTGQELCFINERALEDGSTSRTEQCQYQPDAPVDCAPYERDNCTCQVTDSGGVVIECVL